MIIDVSENMERDENVTAVATFIRVQQDVTRRIDQGDQSYFWAEGGDGAQPGLCRTRPGGKHTPSSIITEVWVEAKVAQ